MGDGQEVIGKAGKEGKEVRIQIAMRQAFFLPSSKRSGLPSSLFHFP
jgi:hypothetical protein